MNIENWLINNNFNIQVMPFIKRMDLAYCISDLIISRAGALSISELTLTGKPSILVPSPNVSEDHQTKNAMSLVTIILQLLWLKITKQTNLYIKPFLLIEDEKLLS